MADRRGCLLWLKALCLLLMVTTALTTRVPRPKLAKPDYAAGPYKSKDGVFEAFQATVQQCPSFMKITEETAGDANYSATIPVVTVEPGGFSEDHSSKIRVLLDFGEHGRELISSEIGLRLLAALCAGGEELAALAALAGVGGEELAEVLNRTVLQVLPMENVRGRERVEAGDLCERKNGRGVDPNRNWGVDWGNKEPDYDPKEEYPGAAPFSEPEALIVRRLAEALQPHVWVNVHSGMEALFMPYDHKATIPEGASANATLELLHALNGRICGGRCAVGSGGKSVGYLAHGTATDWMFESLGVPISMTWEVYGDFNASYQDCFRMFNPLTAEAFNATVDSWAAGVLALLALLPEHPDIPLPPSLAVGGARSVSSQPGGAGAQGAGGGEAAARRERPGVALELDGAGEEEGAGGREQQEQQRKADKAAEIAAALKGHPRPQGGTASGGVDGAASKGQSAGAAVEEGSLADFDEELEAAGWDAQGQGAAGSAGSAAAAGGTAAGAQALRDGGKRGGGLTGWAHRPHLPGTKADWEAVAWFFVAVGGIVGGYLLYSKPRVRYMLSRWGLVSRRSDIPL